jgi:HEAT repeat protein
MSEDRLEVLLIALDEPKQREATIRELGKLKNPRAIPKLGRILTENTGDPLAYRVKQAAAEALGDINDPAALPYLVDALHESPTSVQVNIIAALGRLGDPRSIQALFAALEDDNASVRIIAAEALASLTQAHDVDVVPLVHLLADTEDSVRKAAQAALIQIGVRAVDELLIALKHNNSTVRGAAADILGALQIEDTRQPLTECYYHDQSKWVRSRARAALEQFPGGFTPRTSEANPGLPRRDGPKIVPPKNAIDVIRTNAPPAWPSLRPKPTPHPDDDDDDFTPAQIRAMLDQLDARLAEGEISEATYKKLYARWQARLDEES